MSKNLCEWCEKRPKKYGAICSACYQWWYDKRKRTPSSMINYVAKIDIANNRMSKSGLSNRRKRK